MHKRDIRHTIHLYNTYINNNHTFLIFDVFVLKSDVSFLLFSWKLTIIFERLICSCFLIDKGITYFSLFQFLCMKLYLFPKHSKIYYVWNWYFFQKLGKKNNKEILENPISGNSRCGGGLICISIRFPSFEHW